MLTEEHAQEILRALRTLPPEKITQARDFIRFLQAQYGRATPIDESDAWTDKDLRYVASAATKSAAILERIAALPSEGNGKKFSNREHDRVLYS
ncbi:MAG: hypothetical protein ABR577_17825 [Pyrinomonadaceae bacterium]